MRLVKTCTLLATAIAAAAVLLRRRLSPARSGPAAAFDATNARINGIRAEMTARSQDARSQLHDLRSELNARFEALKRELSAALDSRRPQVSPDPGDRRPKTNTVLARWRPEPPFALAGSPKATTGPDSRRRPDDHPGLDSKPEPEMSDGLDNPRTEENAGLHDRRDESEVATPELERMDHGPRDHIESQPHTG